MNVELVPFVGVAAVVIVTPGVDMALVARNALFRGRKAGLATAIGVNIGVAAWAFAAAIGVAAIVRASATVFTGLKLLGAAYLVYLGIQAWRRGARTAAGVGTTSAPRTGEALRQGIVSNLLNPKIGLFFTAMLPQFAHHDAGLIELLILGAIFNAMGLAWLTAYALAVARGRTLLQRPRVRAAIERITGGVLIGLGVRLALERRGA
ncbi:MAG TPA: LysE family translocator [Actinomycetota bacterium]|nr:LysE family translocator [Actinomycetota bacterium]